jgi:hypothetical protein
MTGKKKENIVPVPNQEFKKEDKKEVLLAPLAPLG